MSVMKAIVQDRYGPPEDVLRIDEVPVPDIAADEVLVRVRASSINPADWHLVRGEPLIARLALGLRGPKHDGPGGDLAGTVEKVGTAVSGFSVGDAVLGAPPENHRGGCAEYCVTTPDLLVLKPSDLPWIQAGSLALAGVTAVEGLRSKLKVSEGQRVMIIGASGGVGSFAVQVAKFLDVEVTGVCSSRNIDYVKSLGADDTLAYDEGDFADGSTQYDAIFQLGGSRSARSLRPALTRNGRLLLAGGEGGGRVLGPVGPILKGLLLSMVVPQSIKTFNSAINRRDLEFLVDLYAQGSLSIPVGEIVGLEEVPQAVARIETAHTQGKIAVEI